MKLVIVESPAKAKTIEKYLGSGFVVDASRGHICDLPVKTMGVDIQHDFKPEYAVRSADQKEIVSRLKKRAEKCDGVYLATDPDREGEAISWHLANALGLNSDDDNRIEFNEISKTAVQNALKSPRKINMQLVDAQQARRVLDRLVGYTLSPVLCKKVQSKLSAGRVQSAALKMLVEREKEVQDFKPEEYWSVKAQLEKPKSKPQFFAELTEYNDKKLKISDKQQCEKVLTALNGANYVVKSVKQTTTSGKNPAPFTTSTMQQDGINKLKMTAAIVRSLSQQLYEGLDIEGMGHVALITYIRTDSTRVSTGAQLMAKNYLKEHFGDDYVPEKFNVFSSGKNAQDAHEAIRPINLDVTPESVKNKIQRGHYNLYKLIYDRFLASQSTKPRYSNVTAKIDANGFTFTATGKTTLFDGYTRFYGESKNADENEKMPALSEGDSLLLKQLTNEQKFTKGPARYTEATLIKAMEEKGIGRPSTFDTIMSVLYKRAYMEKAEKALVPTQLGTTVTSYLDEHFKNIVDANFTAKMESDLDKIEDEGSRWQDVVGQYYYPLEKEVKAALAQDKMRVADEQTDKVCPKCNAPMLLKHGKFGNYYACSNYPDKCDYHYSATAKVAPKMTDIKCEKCGSLMWEREGKFGKYLACSNYPACKNTRSITEVVGKCPLCGKDVAKRISKKGKLFYACTGYPACNFISWDIPLDRKCPKCGAYLLKKVGKTESVHCSNKDCDYDEKG